MRNKREDHKAKGKFSTTGFIGRRVRSARLDRGLKARDIAVVAGISAPFYSALESGSRVFRVDVLGRVIAAIGVDILEVWPPAWLGSASITLDIASLVEIDRLNTFRFREVFVLSKAKAGCLIQQSGHGKPIKDIFCINIPEDELERLRRAVESGRLPAHWQKLTKEGFTGTLSLLLKDAELGGLPLKLAEHYLILWTAAQQL